MNFTNIYIYIFRVSVGLRNTKECSMSYRQSEMYKLTTYLKDLPLQSVSSKKESSGGRQISKNM